MGDKMRTTRDTHTGKVFKWNDTVIVHHAGRDVRVPARYTSRTATHLHPDRVPASLLARLNEEEGSDV